MAKQSMLKFIIEVVGHRGPSQFEFLDGAKARSWAAWRTPWIQTSRVSAPLVSHCHCPGNREEHLPRFAPSLDTSLQLLILGDGFEDFSRDVVAGDPFALGGEVRDDAVAEYRRRHRRHVVAAHVELAMEHGAGFGGQDKVQAGARTGPPRQPFLAEVERF